MTNKKLKFAAMSVALTACVAAQPLAANAAENLRPVADDPAPEQNEPSEASSSSEETVEEIKNETLNPDPEPSEDMDVKEAFGDDVDIKYDPDKATKDEETGTVTTPGDVIRKEDPDQPGETEETDKTGETDPSGSTDETGKTGETDGSEEAGEVIGSAERNETDESSSNTVTPDPGAPSTPSGPSVSGTDEDGNTTITTPTLTPGTDTTITEGTGSATADNEKKPDVTETAPDDINVKDELDGAEIPWDVKADDEKKIGDTQYVVKDVQNDGDKQTLTLEKTESTTDKMTPEDIAKLVDANYQPGEEEGTYTITINDTTQTGFSTTDNGKTYTKTEGNKTITVTDTALDDEDAIKNLLSKQYKVDIDKITFGKNGTASWTADDGSTVEVHYSKTSKLLTMTETVVSHANAPVIDDLVSDVMKKAESLKEGDQLILSGSKKYTITRKDGKLIMKDELGNLVKDAATVKKTVTEIVKTIATNYIHYDELSPEERWELLDLQQGYADGASNKYTGGCDSYWPEEGYENNAGEWKDSQWVAKKDTDGKIIGETPAQPTTNFDHLGLDADVDIETEDGTVIGGLLLNGSLGEKYELSFTYGHKEQIAGYVDMDKYPDKKHDGTIYNNKGELHKTTGALDAKLSTTITETTGQIWNRSKNDYDSKTKLTYTCQDESNTNAFSGKRFYTIVGKVAYNKMDGTYSKEVAGAIVEDLQNNQGKTNALSVPIQLKDGTTVYYVYQDVTDVTATGYMTASANTSAKQNRNGWKPGQKVNGNSIPYNGNHNAGDYDLRIQGLRLVDGKVQGSYGVEYSLNMTTIKNTGTDTDNVLTVLDHTTTHTSTDTDRYGSYTVDYVQDFGWKDSEDETAKVKGAVHDSYTTFKDLIHKIFCGEASGEEEGGSFRYSYKTEKDAELTPVSKTETSVKHAKVKYDYTTIDTAHVLIPGETTVVVTPEDPDLPAPDDETPVVTPETPELPPVQDATPDAEPTTDVVITPATPELPPVQDAAPDVISALPKTGVNWTAAIGMALSGMALMAAGAFTSLFHKAKH